MCGLEPKQGPQKLWCPLGFPLQRPPPKRGCPKKDTYPRANVSPRRMQSMGHSPVPHCSVCLVSWTSHSEPPPISSLLWMQEPRVWQRARHLKAKDGFFFLFRVPQFGVGFKGNQNHAFCFGSFGEQNELLETAAFALLARNGPCLMIAFSRLQLEVCVWQNRMIPSRELK